MACLARGNTLSIETLASSDGQTTLAIAQIHLVEIQRQLVIQTARLSFWSVVVVICVAAEVLYELALHTLEHWKDRKTSGFWIKLSLPFLIGLGVAFGLCKEVRTEGAVAQLSDRLQSVSGPRANLLYGDVRDKLTTSLSVRAGSKVEILICSFELNQFSVDQEAMGLESLLTGILKDAHWQVASPREESCSGTGISIMVRKAADPTTVAAAEELRRALNEVPLDIVGDRVFAVEQGGPTSKDAVLMTVLAHP